MGIERWQHAQSERGKPRVYIQQFLDLRMPEEEYKRIAKELGFSSQPFKEEVAAAMVEAYLEELGDGSQFDTVHIQRGDGIVALMTVVSFPFKQETFDRLLAEHAARKALGSTQSE